MMKSRFAGRERTDLISSEAVRRRFHLKKYRIYDIIGIKKGGDVLKDKIKSFIYYGSENYISLSFYRFRDIMNERGDINGRK